MQGEGDTATMEPALAALIERLLVRFEHRIEPQIIEETVRICAAQFEDARIADYIPLLTEHRCDSQLRALVWATSAVGPPTRHTGAN